ncbi:MAG: glycosyltransferase family 4 protein, partial [Gammaproteobacteria bacterium]
MRPLNVLDLRDTHEIGGPGKTILETFRAIDPAAFTLHLGVFLTRRERDDSPFVAAARAARMPVHLIRGYNQYDPRMIWQVARLVKALRIDIVHAHEVKSDVLTYLASKVHRVPIVTTLHGWFG